MHSPQLAAGIFIEASRGSLVGPVILAGAGFALFANTSALAALLNLSRDSMPALFLRYASGIWMFLAMASLAARFCDRLLSRVAAISRDGTPYPRLLTDLLRVAFFLPWQPS